MAKYCVNTNNFNDLIMAKNKTTMEKPTMNAQTFGEMQGFNTVNLRTVIQMNKGVELTFEGWMAKLDKKFVLRNFGVEKE